MPIDLSKKGQPKYGDIVHQAVSTGKVGFEMRRSIDWFRQKAREVGKYVTPSSLMSETERHRKRYVFGKMYTYIYDPKWKHDTAVLPYYDIFPLIFMVQPAPNGWYGINLHYLPHVLRAKLMDALDAIKNNTRYDETTKLVLSYQVLKSTANLKYFEPCFKHYLSTHIRSPFLKIDADEWNLALFLPVERFKTEASGKPFSKEQVWADSRRRINNRAKKQ